MNSGLALALVGFLAGIILIGVLIYKKYSSPSSNTVPFTAQLEIPEHFQNIVYPTSSPVENFEEPELPERLKSFDGEICLVNRPQELSTVKALNKFIFSDLKYTLKFNYYHKLDANLYINNGNVIKIQNGEVFEGNLPMIPMNTPQYEIHAKLEGQKSSKRGKLFYVEIYYDINANCIYMKTYYEQQSQLANRYRVASFVNTPPRDIPVFLEISGGTSFYKNKANIVIYNRNQ